VTRLKLKFYTLFLLQCNQCSIDSTLIDSDLICWRKKEHFLWRSPKHLGSDSFDQRCNVNLIMRKALVKDSTSLIRGIVLTWSWIAHVVDWHQERVTFGFARHGMTYSLRISRRCWLLCLVRVWLYRRKLFARPSACQLSNSGWDGCLLFRAAEKSYWCGVIYCERHYKTCL